MKTTAQPTTLPFHLKSAVQAGLIAGLVFIALEMLLVPLVGGGSAWGPPRTIAAIVLGQDILPGPDNPPTFDLGIFITAMLVHFGLSIILAVIFAAILAAVPMLTGVAVALGVVFGLGVYLVMFYGFTAVFPWFAMARGAITIVAHVAFGAVLAWSYRSIAPTNTH